MAESAEPVLNSGLSEDPRAWIKGLSGEKAGRGGKQRRAA